MSDTKPGADELRVRGILRRRGVGPDAASTPTIPPKPTEPPRDWLDEILDSNTSAPEEPPPPTEPEPQATEPKPPKKTKPPTRKQKRKRAKRHDPATPRTAWDTQPPSPRQSLLDAWDAVPYRLKWLGYHASAAYMGWELGAVGYATYVTAWIAHTGLIGVQAFFWYGAAAACFLFYRRTRAWWWPTAWLAAIPACSTVAGVLLYGTPHP